jgi:hypothetical protein
VAAALRKLRQKDQQLKASLGNIRRPKKMSKRKQLCFCCPGSLLSLKNNKLLSGFVNGLSL